MILAPDHVRDVHFEVIHHVDEMEHGLAIGSHNNEVRIGLLTISCVAIRKQALFHDGEFQRVAETTVVIGEHGDLPALFADPLDLMPVALAIPQVRERCRLLERDLTQQPPTAKDLFVRDVRNYFRTLRKSPVS